MQPNKLPITAFLVIIAMITLSRYTEGVRDVAILGIFSSGVLVGIALMNVVMFGRNRKAKA
jgi:hypothetical protein